MCINCDYLEENTARANECFVQDILYYEKYKELIEIVKKRLRIAYLENCLKKMQIVLPLDSQDKIIKRNKLEMKKWKEHNNSHISYSYNTIKTCL